jgi:zinc and cadmium transporter
MVMTLSLACVAIVTASVLGGLVPLSSILNHTRLQVYLSFSAGTMLGAAFFHMMPEAVRVGSAATVPWTAVGLLALFFLERFFSFHQHEPREDGPAVHPEGAHTHHDRADSCGHAATLIPEASRNPGTRRPGAAAVSALPWGSAAFGLAVHSLVGGVALASAVAADFHTRDGLGAAGIGVLLATLVHKPADALTITSLMVRAGSSGWSAHLVNLGFALMIPAGVVLFLLGEGGMPSSSATGLTAGALAFSAGTFLCIALSDLLPELQFHSHDRFKLSVALLAGVGLMAVTAAIVPGQ